MQSSFTHIVNWIILLTGARAETGARTRGNQGYETEGVQGLKALGVRDLCYRMAYLACTVTTCNRKVSGKQQTVMKFEEFDQCDVFRVALYS